MTGDADLLVLGAGPAGLAAARRVADAGHRVVVVEREEHVGGAAGSLQVAGVRVDRGSHRLHRSTDPAILADLRDLLGGDLQERRRDGRIRLAGRWLGFPLRMPGALSDLPPDFAARAAVDAVRTALTPDDRTSFDTVVRTRLGPAMADRFYGPYARKLWGLEPGLIDARQADVRISADSPAKILRRLLPGGHDRATFLYPRRGFGQIAESLAAAARAAGAEIALSTTVTGVESGPDRVAARTAAGDRLVAPRLWSTIPLPVLARLADAPPAVLRAAGRLSTRAMVLVYLALSRPRHTRFDAHYLPEPVTPLTRLSEPKNYRDGHPTATDAGDPTDRTVLCAELPCDVGDRHWQATPDALADVVLDALRTTGLPAVGRHDLLDVHVERLGSAYPVYRRSFRAHLDVVDAWAAAQPRLLTFGRQGLFVHDNTHHALAMAWAASGALGSDGTFDEDAWAAARRRFEDHVVED